MNLIKKNVAEIYLIFLSIVSILFIVNYKPFGNISEHHITKVNPYNNIGIDNLEVFIDTIKEEETLYSILIKWGISDNNKINLIISKSKEIFDIEKIKGETYLVLCEPDSSKKVMYMIYETKNSDYVIFDLKDTISIYTSKYNIKSSIKTCSGIITSSLWDAIENSNIGIDIAMHLYKIYAWNIDFYELQKGDWYKVLYEEISINDKPVAVKKILASIFYTNNEENKAFYFEKDNLNKYYDEDGKSLKKTFLKAPIQFQRISSSFNYNRYHPILKYYRPHLGIDYSAPIGTPVFSVGDGIIEKINSDNQAGLMVKIIHNNTGYSTAYLHLGKIDKKIKTGEKVKQGQLIGYVGNSGLSTGPHLEFRFYKDNKPINPLYIQSQSAKSIDSVYLFDFIKLKNEMMHHLTAIELKEKKTYINKYF